MLHYDFTLWIKGVESPSGNRLESPIAHDRVARIGYGAVTWSLQLTLPKKLPIVNESYTAFYSFTGLGTDTPMSACTSKHKVPAGGTHKQAAEIN
ncbi:MAG: hypothetical protein A3J28_02265 [Acidobacteria bacterium RIFCSPLOWO2_12_FULL_60_22]|nr:MAG: hypothetical protein A3J28_02265 [Acidobacteria bacterium RIFCSPLOWO2_12_FULL_60_22]